LAGLLKIAEGGPNPLAIPAANKLLERFSPDLTPAQHARLVALTLDTSNWRTPEFQIELLKMKHDVAYGELIKSTSQRLVSQGFPRPLLDLLRQAESDPTIWETIVWNELCTGSFGRDAEKHGQWILDLARDLPEQRNAVGSASRKFLFDPRLQQPQTQDAITWLALLAHEAGQLSQTETEQVIVRHSPIYAGAMVPLLARLGHIPTNLRPRHSVASDRDLTGIDVTVRVHLRGVRGSNPRRRYGNLHKSGRHVIDEAGDEPISRQCGNRSE
jgi:hypothetical protein